MPIRRNNREERRARLETLMEDFRAKPKPPDNATLALRRASRAMKEAKAAVERASRTRRRKTD